jgi:hypothetical protein
MVVLDEFVSLGIATAEKDNSKTKTKHESSVRIFQIEGYDGNVSGSEYDIDGEQHLKIQPFPVAHTSESD